LQFTFVIFYAWVPGERQKISDLSVIAESLRRQKDPEKYKDEAKALISLGVLYDNAQVSPHCIQSTVAVVL
jgi:hypothetical protein